MALKTEIIRIDPRKLKLLEKNARHLPFDEYNLLVKNIKADGCLTSSPLVYQGEVLSGNHRVRACIDAGIEEVDAINILSEMTEDHKKALILSHNALSGKDDLSILKEIYDSIEDAYEKQFSAINEKVFDIEPLKIDSLGFAKAKHEEIILSYLPEDSATFLESLEEIQKAAKNKLLITASIHDQDDIIKAVTKVKAKMNIINTSFAFRVMAKIVLDYLNDENTKETSK